MEAPVNEDTTVYTLSFADDQVGIVQNINNMEHMTRKLSEEH